jgi:hypothetical protein
LPRTPVGRPRLLPSPRWATSDGRTRNHPDRPSTPTYAHDFAAMHQLLISQVVEGKGFVHGRFRCCRYFDSLSADRRRSRIDATRPQPKRCGAAAQMSKAAGDDQCHRAAPPVHATTRAGRPAWRSRRTKDKFERFLAKGFGVAEIAPRYWFGSQHRQRCDPRRGAVSVVWATGCQPKIPGDLGPATAPRARRRP